jgi:alkylation response protein AidB-like acyl-CoA dehydrogenase
MNVPQNLNEVTEIARDIAVTVLAEDAVQVDREAMWPERGIRTLQASGLGGLLIPQAWGGVGQGLKSLLLVCEELGRECPSTALSFGMHCVGSAVIAARATPEQAEDMLTPIAKGEHLTTLALSESGTGSYFYFPQTIIEKDDECYLLTGTKSFVTNGGHADSYVVSGLAPLANFEQPEYSCVVVPHDIDGLKWGPSWAGMGMRGNSSINAVLDRVKVSKDKLLGNEGDQIWFFFNVIAPYFLTAMAGTYLGIAKGAFDDTLSHIRNRSYSHSGVNLSEATVIQHRIGKLFGLLESTRCLALSAAEQFELGDDTLPSILSSKAEVADCAVEIVNECMTLIGGVGYGKQCRMQQRLRDVRAAHVMAPTTDLLRIWTGRALLDEPLLKE